MVDEPNNLTSDDVTIITDGDELIVRSLRDHSQVRFDKAQKDEMLPLAIQGVLSDDVDAGGNDITNIGTAGAETLDATTANTDELNTADLQNASQGDVLEVSGSPPELTLGTGGGGGLTPLRSVSASSQSTVDFDQNIGSTYREYVIKLIEVVPASDGAKLSLRVSTDGGSTYVSSSSAYRYAINRILSDGSQGVDAAGADSRIFAFEFIGNAGEEGLSGSISISAPTQSGAKTRITSDGTYDASGGKHITSTGGGQRQAAEANDAIRLQFDSGNIASGTFDLYGVAKP